MKLKFTSVWSLFQCPPLFLYSAYFAIATYSHVTISSPLTGETRIFVTNTQLSFFEMTLL